jgi:hypothetical protein
MSIKSFLTLGPGWANFFLNLLTQIQTLHYETDYMTMFNNVIETFGTSFSL